MLCSTPRMVFLLNHLRIKWMKWYIWKFPSAKMFLFYIFTLLMFIKTNKTTINKNKTINSYWHMSFRFSFIFRYFKVFQLSGRLANQGQNPVSINQSEARKKNQSESRIQKETTNQLHWCKVSILLKADKRAETHTSFDMSRKSKLKDQTKALNIPFTLTQGDLVQEALAVAKDQIQALNIPVKVPLGGGRYA